MLVAMYQRQVECTNNKDGDVCRVYFLKFNLFAYAASVFLNAWHLSLSCDSSVTRFSFYLIEWMPQTCMHFEDLESKLEYGHVLRIGGQF